MQSLEDIKIIRFEILGSVRLDLERVAEDPVWNSVAVTRDISTEEGLKGALVAYFQHYFSHESLMQEVPATCGPADIYMVKARVHEKGRKETVTDGHSSVGTNN